MNKAAVHRPKQYSLGAKSCNVSLRLTQELAKVCVIIMTGKNP